MGKTKVAVDGFSLAAEFIPYIAWMSTAKRMLECVNTHATDYAGLPTRKAPGMAVDPAGAPKRS